MEAAFCVETLENALAHHGKADIFNTDQGSQFTGSAFTGMLTNHDIAIHQHGRQRTTTADVHIRLLTAAPRIKPTSTRCHSAWQPRPGRGSTYRRGDFCSDKRDQLRVRFAKMAPPFDIETKPKLQDKTGL
jgi:putative transposase